MARCVHHNPKEGARKHKRCVLSSVVGWRKLSVISFVGVGFRLLRDWSHFSVISEAM